MFAVLCNVPEEKLQIAAEKYRECQFNKGEDEALRLLYKFATSPKKESALDDYRRSSNALKQWLDGSQPDKLYANKQDPFPIPTRYQSKLNARSIPFSSDMENQPV